MRGKSASVTVLLLCLIISSTFASSIVSAQDIQSDRSSIQVLLILGNDRTFGGSENFSFVKTYLGETNPDTGLGFNLTVKGSAISENDLKGIDLVIASIPNASSIPNATIFRQFAESGHSLFLLSDYYGGGTGNSSSVLNRVLNESNIHNVSFGKDAISIGNATSEWQTKIYNNITFAVRVNSSRFQSSISIFSGISNVVTISCSLNITSPSDPSFLGLGSAPSDPNSHYWLLLINDGVHRSVLCGSASMFNNTYLGVENNQALLRQLVLWLAEKFQVPPLTMFPYILLTSSAISVLGIAIYLVSRRTRHST
jgi:hypothetical protein